MDPARKFVKTMQRLRPVQRPRMIHLWCRILLDDVLDLLLVCCAILLEQVVCFRLGWRVWVGVVEQILNADQDVFDRDRWLPTFVFVQN